MKLLSVNVGLPREIEWQGKLVRTSIFKSPVSGNVRVKTLNLEGDEQSDLSVHGGVHKAVYAYPSEHYRFWREEVPGIDLEILSKVVCGKKAHPRLITAKQLVLVAPLHR